MTRARETREARPAAKRLPRGRHGLSREEVASAQRERLFRAMAEVTAARGYASTSVADVLRAAGISRETFYQQFSSKEDCFMQAYAAAAEGIARSMAAGAGERAGSADPLDRLERILGDYLGALAAEPELARMLLIEVYAVGSAALERRAQQQRQIAVALAGALGAADAEGQFACEALIAAVGAMVTTRLAAGDLEGLRELREPLVKLARRVLPV